MAETATNPETGEKIQLNEVTGQWEPIAPAGFLGKMISNIPASAAQFASDVTAPILSPIQTAKGVGGLIGGTAQKLARQAQEAAGSRSDQPINIPKGSMEQYPEAFGQFMSSRYGSPEAIKQTVQTDPVGSLADVAGLLTIGGGAASKIPGIAGKVGRGVSKIGAGMEPINLLGAPTKAAIGAMTPKSLPANLYKSAAKFPTTLDIKYGPGTRTRLAETAVKKRMMPTEAGVLKLEQFETDFGNKIGGLIDKATETGGKIPKSQVYKYLKEARRSVGGVRVGAKKNLAQVNQVAKDLTDQIKKIKGDYLTPRQMQDLKISAQAAAKYVPGTVPEKGAEKAAKAIAKASREGIEEAVPGVADINKELAKLKELKEPLSRAAARIENRDLISIGTPLKTMAGGELMGGRGAIAGALAGMAEGKKAEMAMGLQALQDAGLGNLIDPSIKAALIEQGLMQSGRAGDVLKEQ